MLTKFHFQIVPLRLPNGGEDYCMVSPSFEGEWKDGDELKTPLEGEAFVPLRLFIPKNLGLYTQAHNRSLNDIPERISLSPEEEQGLVRAFAVLNLSLSERKKVLALLSAEFEEIG